MVSTAIGVLLVLALRGIVKSIGANEGAWLTNWEEGTGTFSWCSSDPRTNITLLECISVGSAPGHSTVMKALLVRHRSTNTMHGRRGRYDQPAEHVGGIQQAVHPQRHCFYRYPAAIKIRFSLRPYPKQDQTRRSHHSNRFTMRLIHTKDPRLQQFSLAKAPSKYVLSHTWEEEEITLQDLERGVAQTMKGYLKLRASCLRAAEDGYEWIWIDTCCIDKTSSAEKSPSAQSTRLSNLSTSPEQPKLRNSPKHPEQRPWAPWATHLSILSSASEHPEQLPWAGPIILSKINRIITCFNLSLFSQSHLI
jgi:hypothetical protein